MTVSKEDQYENQYKQSQELKHQQYQIDSHFSCDSNNHKQMNNIINQKKSLHSLSSSFSSICSSSSLNPVVSENKTPFPLSGVLFLLNNKEEYYQVNRNKHCSLFDWVKSTDNDIALKMRSTSFLRIQEQNYKLILPSSGLLEVISFHTSPSWMNITLYVISLGHKFGESREVVQLCLCYLSRYYQSKVLQRFENHNHSLQQEQQLPQQLQQQINNNDNDNNNNNHAINVQHRPRQFSSSSSSVPSLFSPSSEIWLDIIASFLLAHKMNGADPERRSFPIDLMLKYSGAKNSFSISQVQKQETKIWYCLKGALLDVTPWSWFKYYYSILLNLGILAEEEPLINISILSLRYLNSSIIFEALVKQLDCMLVNGILGNALPSEIAAASFYQIFALSNMNQLKILSNLSRCDISLLSSLSQEFGHLPSSIKQLNKQTTDLNTSDVSETYDLQFPL